MDTQIDAPGPEMRRVARIGGVWFVITFVASIAGALLYTPVLDDSSYILGGGADARISLGAFLEIVLAIANIATAVVLFPVLKRYSESIALGYVATRIVESTIIVIGLVSLLAVVKLRKDGVAGADHSSFVVTGKLLVAIHDRTSLLGPAFCAGFGNGILLGYLMFKSRLVPRRMALLGVIGGPLAFASATGVLFDIYKQGSAPSVITTVPEAAWEASLGIYLIWKGFKPSAQLLRPTGALRAPAAEG